MEENQSISPEEQEEFEFRLRYEQEQAATQQQKAISDRTSVIPYAAPAAIAPIASAASGVVDKVVKPVLQEWGAKTLGEAISHPWITGADTLKAIAPHFMNSRLSDLATKETVKNFALKGLQGGAKAISAAALAPENIIAAPYMGAAYEMDKIRQNPNAPEYANNPYAMQQRGVAPTMGAAGAQNRRAALSQMPSLQPIQPGQQ